MSKRSERREADRLARKAAYEATRQAQTTPAHNATRHGCCALDVLILPSERMEDYEAVEDAWHETYKPKDEAAVNLVDQLVAADWLYRRSVRTLSQIESQIHLAAPNPMDWTDDHHKKLTKFQRYRTANQNAFNKARKAVEEHLKFHMNEHQIQARLEIAKSRQMVYQQKLKPEPSLSELMTMMNQKAIALRHPSLQPPKDL